MPLVFITAYVLPAHHPKANGLQIAVAGSRSAARPIVKGLGDVKLVAVPDARAAVDAVRDRSVYGSIVTSPHRQVNVASGASFVVASSLRQGAVKAGVRPAEIHDVAPLPSGDPRGVSLNSVVLALLITSITGAALAVALMPEVRAGPREAGVLLVAVLVGIGTTGILKALSALPGSPFAETALFAATVFAVTLIAGSLIRLRGSGGTTLGFLIFLVIAQPASGLAAAPDLLPTPWKQLGPLLPPGAVGSALHGTAYFGGAAVLAPILTLAGWAAVGVGLNIWIDRRVRRPSRTPAAPAAAAAAVPAHA